MVTRISVLQPSGGLIVLEVTPETTGRELKQRIKEGQPWDELTRSTTGVEIILDDANLLANDQRGRRTCWRYCGKPSDMHLVTCDRQSWRCH